MIALDYGKVLSVLARKYRVNDFRPRKDWEIEWPLVYVGPAGCGKTCAALQYCGGQQISFYFSFRNISSDFALKLFPNNYPELLNDCDSWDKFFDAISNWTGQINHGVIIFDDWDESRVDDSFTNAMRKFLLNHPRRNVFIILLSRKKPKDDKYYVKEMVPLSPAYIRKTFPEMTEEDRLRLFSVTDGYPGLLSYYDPSVDFSSNLSKLIDPDSRFFHYAEEQLNTLFRIPEGYTNILYGLLQGKNRLSDLSDYVGYSLNKLDKYLKVLIENGLVTKKTVHGNDRRSLSRYELRSGYIKIWCKIFLGKTEKNYPDISQIIKYIDDELVRDTFKKECLEWLKRHYYDVYYRPLRTEDYKNYDVAVGDIVFDYVQRDDKRLFVAKIWTDLNVAHNKKDLEKIIEETKKETPFYNTHYCFFSIHRFADSAWKMSQENGNMRLIEARFLTGTSKTFIL